MDHPMTEQELNAMLSNIKVMLLEYRSNYKDYMEELASVGGS